jgi:hypothetical protein
MVKEGKRNTNVIPSMYSGIPHRNQYTIGNLDSFQRHTTTPLRSIARMAKTKPTEFTVDERILYKRYKTNIKTVMLIREAYDILNKKGKAGYDMILEEKKYVNAVTSITLKTMEMYLLGWMKAKKTGNKDRARGNWIMIQDLFQSRMNGRSKIFKAIRDKR